MKKRFKIPLIIILVIAALLAIVAIAGPSIAKKYIEKHDTELIGREVTLDRVRINPILAKVTVEGLRIMEADGQTLFVKADKVMAQAGLFNLFRKEFYLKHALLDGFDGILIQDGDTMNIDDIVEKFSTTEEEADTVQEKELPLTINLNDIRIKNSAVRYSDLSLGSSFNINNLNIVIPGIYLDGEKKTDAALEFDLAPEGHLRVDLGYGIGKNDLDVKLAISKLDIGLFKPYLDSDYDISDFNGQLTTDLHAVGSSQHLAKLVFDGTASIRDLKVTDADRNPALEIDSISMGINRLDLQNDDYRFSKMHAIGLKAWYHIFEDESTNFDKIIRSDADTTEDSSSYKLRIAELKVDNGTVDYYDESLRNPFKYTISSICADSKGIDLDGDNTVHVTAALNSGRLMADWHGSLEENGNQDLKLALLNVDLRDFSPYCEEYTAYPLTNGVLTVTSKTTIDSCQLASENMLDAHALKVGKKIRKIKPEIKIPMRAAVYALTDKNDHTHITLPVTGDVSDPDFHYRRAMFKTLGKLLVKVVASPFSYLAEAMGIGASDSLNVDVTPMIPEFTTSQTDKMLKLKEKMEVYPNFKLSARQYFPIKDTSEAQRLMAFAHKRDSIAAIRLAVARENITTAPLDSLIGYKGKAQYVITISSEQTGVDDDD